MTLDDLKHIFRFQTTAEDKYTPTDTVEYQLIDASGRLTLTCKIDELETLLPSLDNFVLDAYRDRTPIFVKPESE